MTLKAKADILENYKRHKAGEIFETDEETGLVLLEYGWAEKAEPKKRTRRKKE